MRKWTAHLTVILIYWIIISGLRGTAIAAPVDGDSKKPAPASSGAEAFFMRLRQQYAHIKLDVDYTMRIREQEQESGIVHKLEYIRDAERFDIRERVYENEELLRTVRVNYDGDQLIHYWHEPEFNPPHRALVVGGGHFGLYHIGNDLLVQMGLAGFRGGIEDKNRDARLVGEEILDGLACRKIVQIMPYKDGERAYIYWWFSEKPWGLLLVQTRCLIEDDPGRIVYEVRNRYDLSSRSLMPASVTRRRYGPAESGRSSLARDYVIEIDRVMRYPVFEENAFKFDLPEETVLRYEGFTKEQVRAIRDPDYVPDAATPVTAPPESAANRFTFTSDGMPILLPVRLGEKDYHFMLDTGCSSTFFDFSLKRFVGEQLGRERVKTTGNTLIVDYYQSPDAYLGRFNLKKTKDVCLINLSMLGDIIGRDISGIIGMSFLKHHVLYLDFDEGRLLIDPCTAVTGREWDMQCAIEYDQMGIPTVQGLLNDTLSVTFDIDTGANHSGDLNQETFRQILSEADDPRLAEAVYATAGGVRTGRVMRLDRLGLGGMSYDDLLFSEGRTMLLGLGFWARHKVLLDFPGNRLYLQRGEVFGIKDEADMSGLHLLLHQGRVTVYSVDVGSQSEKAGVRAGDVLQKIDGKDADTFDIGEIRRLLRSEGDRRIPMVLDRNGETIDVVLVLQKRI